MGLTCSPPRTRLTSSPSTTMVSRLRHAACVRSSPRTARALPRLRSSPVLARCRNRGFRSRRRARPRGVPFRPDSHPVRIESAPTNSAGTSRHPWKPHHHPGCRGASLRGTRAPSARLRPGVARRPGERRRSDRSMRQLRQLHAAPPSHPSDGQFRSPYREGGSAPF